MINLSGKHQSGTSGQQEDSSNREGCRAHWKLNEWQVRQYRQAIDENMWYMGERLGRAVTWEEAEYDFLHNEYYGCAPLWRQEYCTVQCCHFTDCDLGQRIVKQ